MNKAPENQWWWDEAPLATRTGRWPDGVRRTEHWYRLADGGYLRVVAADHPLSELTSRE